VQVFSIEIPCKIGDNSAQENKKKVDSKGVALLSLRDSLRMEINSQFLEIRIRAGKVGKLVDML
jgi:hypothetical protein